MGVRVILALLVFAVFAILVSTIVPSIARQIAQNSSSSSSNNSSLSSSFGFSDSKAKTAIKSYVSTRVQSLGGSPVSDIPTLTITQKSKDSKGWTAEGTIMISFRDGDFKEFKYRASGDFYDDGSYRCNSFGEK